MVMVRLEVNGHWSGKINAILIVHAFFTDIFCINFVTSNLVRKINLEKAHWHAIFRPCVRRLAQFQELRTIYRPRT